MDLKPLITLVAIINPLAIVPFFIHYTEGFSAQQRQQTIRTAALASFCVIAACAIIGLQVLDFFNISLQSFQVGGGLLLLISAMNMLNARPGVQFVGGLKIRVEIEGPSIGQYGKFRIGNREVSEELVEVLFVQLD